MYLSLESLDRHSSKRNVAKLDSRIYLPLSPQSCLAGIRSAGVPSTGIFCVGRNESGFAIGEDTVAFGGRRDGAVPPAQTFDDCSGGAHGLVGEIEDSEKVSLFS